MIELRVGVCDGKGKPILVYRFAVGVLKNHAHEVRVFCEIESIVKGAVVVRQFHVGEGTMIKTVYVVIGDIPGVCDESAGEILMNSGSVASGEDP